MESGFILNETHELQAPPTRIMKHKLLLCLALVWSVGWFSGSTQAQQSTVSKEDESQWGQPVDGFQMTAILDKTNGIVHCRIRNATASEMDYPSFDFGYCEFVHLEVQETTNCMMLAAGRLPPGTVSDACPYFTKKIKPGQNITRSVSSWPVLSREEYLKMSHGNTNEALLTERLNKWFADRQALCWDDTFAIDLIEATWPTNIFERKFIRVRASQTFRADPHRFGDQTRTIYS